MDIRNKKILITGGNGFLGKHLVSLLKLKGCKYIFTPDSKKYNLVKEEDVQMMFRNIRPYIVIHLAAAVGGIGANQKNPGKFFYDNLMMGAHVIEQSRIRNVQKLVMVGTVCSYPKFTPVPFKEEDLWNGYPEETNAPYGIAKKALLVQCQAYREQYGLNSIYLIPVNLYGPGDNFDVNSSHVIPALIKKCVDAIDNNDESIECWGTGSASREFLYVIDAVEAIVKATEEYDGSEPVNIGAGFEITMKDLVDEIVCLSGFPGQIKWDNSKPDGQPRRCLNTDKAKEYFDFKVGTKFEDGLKNTIEWYINERDKK